MRFGVIRLLFLGGCEIQNEIAHKVKEEHYNSEYSKEEIKALWEEAEKLESECVPYDDIRDNFLNS